MSTPKYKAGDKVYAAFGTKIVVATVTGVRDKGVIDGNYLYDVEHSITDIYYQDDIVPVPA